MVNTVTGHIHMPNNSYYPVIVAIGIFVGAMGLLFNTGTITIGLLHMPVASALGILIGLLGIYGWAFEPAADPEPVHVEHDAVVGH
jgi:hypothetical protein